MALLNPITSPAKPRDFAVIDLEWIPGERLPLPVNTTVEFEGMRDTIRIPMPVGRTSTDPLKVRLASYYDEVSEEGLEDEAQRVEDFHSFTTVRELVDHCLTSSNRNRWFYAHAGGLSDMEFVLEEILKDVQENLISDKGKTYTRSQQRVNGQDIVHRDYHRGPYKIRASFSGSSAIIVHVTRGKNSWHFCDSYWLLRDKLASIGKAIKEEKGDTPETLAFLRKKFGTKKLSELSKKDLGKYLETFGDVPLEALSDIERRRYEEGVGRKALEDLSQDELETFYRDAPLPVLIAYNRVDCRILWRAIKQFEKEIRSLGGQLQQTIASTGMNLFRRSYLKQTIYTSERLNDIADASYFASRVEVLSRNCYDEFLMYDINSSFPYSMTFPQPAGLKEVRSSIPDEWLDMASGYSDPNDPRELNIFIADVTIEVPDMVLPPVPYRVDGRVFFPIGRWRSWLTSTDIRLAIREGCKLHKVHEVYVFNPFWDLKGYADDIYAKRAASDEDFRKLVLKYLLNSLYGKYAESPFKQEMLINPEEIDREKMQLLQPGIWLAEKVATIAHRHVPISTHITAIARRTLYDSAKECYRQGHSLFYCDTDSLATKADLPADPKKLGALKLEKKLMWAEFIAPKIYRGEGFELQKNGQWAEDPFYMTKAKGFSLGKSKGEAKEKFDRIASGDRIGIQRQVRLRELYRSGETAPIDIMVIKALTFEMLTKRYHYPDGETRPWSIEELVSGEVYPKGFDFEPEILATIDTTTRAMMEACV